MPFDLGRFLIPLLFYFDAVQISGLLADLPIKNSADGGIEEEEDEEMLIRGADG